jgi:hypothetical protein
MRNRLKPLMPRDCDDGGRVDAQIPGRCSSSAGQAAGSHDAFPPRLPFPRLLPVEIGERCSAQHV